MPGNYPKPTFKKLFSNDYHFQTFTIFTALLLLPVLWNWYLIFITGWLLIWTIWFVAYRYIYVSSVLENGIECKAKIMNIWRPRRRYRNDVESLGTNSSEGMYIIKVSFDYAGNEVTPESLFKYSSKLGDLKKGGEISILINSKRPKRFLIKETWIPAGFMKISSIN